MEMMRKKISRSTIVFVLILIAAALMFFFLSLEYRDRKLETFERRIRNLEELVTARQIYRNVIYTEIKENLIVDKRALFTIDYIVTAGVDLSSGVRILAESNSIKVLYPRPEIFSVDADESSIDEYFSLQRFGKLKQSDYLNILYDEKIRIEEDALNGGILDRADKNLRSLIRSLLKKGGIEEILFEPVRSGDNDEDV